MILIINGKDGLAHAVHTTLSNAGFTTVLAANSAAAIEQLSCESPSLILLGETAQSIYQETRLLRSHPKTADVPIVLQSDDFSLLNEEYRSRLGAQAVLSNHHSASSLLEEVHQFLNLVH